MEHMANLFSFCRSITGAGTRATLSTLNRIFLFSRIQFPTGTSCFDWLIPNEWNITDCFIEHIDSGHDFSGFPNLTCMSLGIPLWTVSWIIMI